MSVIEREVGSASGTTTKKKGQKSTLLLVLSFTIPP
jgi:hypothetical protein